MRMGGLNCRGPQSVVRICKANESLKLSDRMKGMKVGDRNRGQENGLERKDGRRLKRTD